MSDVITTNPNAVAVLYMMGQSNLWGDAAFHSKVDKPQYDTEPAGMFIWNKIAGNEPHTPGAPGDFVPLTTGFGFQNPPGSNPDAIGSEMQLSFRFRNLGKDLYFIKTARGGTSIEPDPKRLDWSPESEGELYDVWNFHYHRAAIEWLYSRRKTPHLLGVFWAQGAGDATTNAPPGAAGNYEANLVNLMQRIRTDIGVPNASFAIQRETNLAARSHPGLQQVRDAQTAVGNADTRAITFNSDTIPGGGPNGRDFYEKHDGEHYTGNGQVDFGNDAAGQLSRLTAGAALPVIPRPSELSGNL